MKFSIMATERTNNFTDPAIQAKITGLWEKNSGAVKKAAEKGTVIACVYHEYESNYQGDYAVSLCFEETEQADFDTDKFTWKKYPIDRRDAQGILTTWRQIWSEEENQQLQRRYSFDFEQYAPDGEVTIFIAIAESDKEQLFS